MSMFFNATVLEWDREICLHVAIHAVASPLIEKTAGILIPSHPCLRHINSHIQPAPWQREWHHGKMPDQYCVDGKF